MKVICFKDLKQYLKLLKIVSMEKYMEIDKEVFHLDFECMTPLPSSDCTSKLYIKYDSTLQVNVIYKLITDKNRIEAEIHLKLDHKYITKIYWYKIMSNYTLICMKYYNCLNLQDFLDLNENFALIYKIKILKQLCMAVSYLHRNNIVHRDIKPSNILIDDNFDILLCDFGFAKEIKDNEYLTDYCGSIRSAPPEIFLNVPYDGKKVDVWCVGIVFYILLYGNYPQRNSDFTLTTKPTTQNTYPAIINILLYQMLNKEPKKRINIDKLLIYLISIKI